MKNSLANTKQAQLIHTQIQKTSDAQGPEGCALGSATRGTLPHGL